MVGKPLVPMVLLVQQEGVEVQEVEQQVHAQLLLHLPKSPSPQFLRQVLMKMMTANPGFSQRSVLMRLVRSHTARAVQQQVAEQGVAEQVVLAVQRPPDPVAAVAAVAVVVVVVVLGLVGSHMAMAHLLLLI